MTIEANSIYRSPLVRRLVALAIEEDLGFGDLTSRLSINPVWQGTGVLVAKEAGVIAGLPLARIILEEGGAQLSQEWTVSDGQEIAVGQELGRLSGSLAELLAIERVLLNFVQRLSGVATLTRTYVEQAGRVRVLDTRKTTPGWRVLEKYAVALGGGSNHRMSLGDQILVKDNHIDSHPQGLPGVMSDIKSSKPAYAVVEVEVRTEAELKTALGFEPDVVMLDNMDNAQIQSAMELISKSRRKPLVEISGGITLERIPALAETGIDGVSVGALTHSSAALDISMRIDRSP